MIQRKLDVLNKAGLSKDNFMDSESHSVQNAAAAEADNNHKITDYFSTSLTEEDMAALDEDWDGGDDDEHDAKKQKLL